MNMIAFLGLGRMGTRMARRLVAAGHDLSVWNRTPMPSAMPGAQAAHSAAAAVADAELVLTMLSDPAAVTDVLFGQHDAVAAMRPGSLLIEMSTIGPHAVADIRRRLPESIGLVDAPVLGGLEPAASGSLLVLAGGSQTDLNRAEKVLEALGEVRHLGPLGSGAAMKLAVMGVMVPMRVLLAETLAAADANGLDRAALLDILASRGLASFTAQTAPAEETRYALAHAAKDLTLAQQDLGRPGVGLGMLAEARTRLAEAKRTGLGGRDLSVIYGQEIAVRNEHVQKINPSTVPAPGGAYSHAVRAGDFLFVSGQAALDDGGNVVGEGDIDVQSEFVFDCLERILADQGATFDDVVSIRTYLTDMTMLPRYGGVRRRRITGKPPSSTTVEVPKLFRPGLLIEVDVVAALPSRSS
jgi:3-hydroxyisobutyrate dehydrogenase-like beta-hydroxyacid dehydrogenase/enamine deaminase RidA (YjgF/YER057c/UK114 family)